MVHNTNQELKLYTCINHVLSKRNITICLHLMAKQWRYSDDAASFRLKSRWHLSGRIMRNIHLIQRGLSRCIYPNHVTKKWQFLQVTNNSARLEAFPHYWSFVRSLVDSHHKRPVMQSLGFPLLLVGIGFRTNGRVVSDLGSHCAHVRSP